MLVFMNADPSILSTEAGMQSDVSERHRENASSSIWSNCDPDSKHSDESISQAAKHRLPIISTDAGTQIEPICNRPENAPFSILLNLEPDSKVITDSDSQARKQSQPSISTEAGMQTSSSEAQPENAPTSIRDSIEIDSNFRQLRDRQPEKQFWPMIVMDEGMVNDLSRMQEEKADSAICPGLDPEEKGENAKGEWAKQNLPKNSTVSGREIDLSEPQFEKAPSAIARRREFGSKVSLPRKPQCEKHDLQIVSTECGMQRIRSKPKYRMRERRSKSIRKLSQELKCQFSESTEIAEMPVLMNADPSILSTEAGM
jgi:hypothetical protein